ncbi:MAG: deoxyribose-phosphate aldolase [Clostridiaceae bacterium]|jgi:deoxyribose-phosphate aldolase|nr:deoxyribose-phosphate aldolase [Clostridiaceae bacterium]
MNIQYILSKCDHSLLAPAATLVRIKTLIDEAVAFKTASVCIPPSFVARATEYVKEKYKDMGGVLFKLAAGAAKYVNGKIPVCTVIGFPNGYSVASAKVLEAETAIADGAEEIDTVINVGDVKDGAYGSILTELQLIKSVCGNKILKVIIEACLLTDAEKIEMCKVVTDSGADFIKTSTGFSSGGATLADVELFKKHVGKGVKIKAAGGIRTLETANAFISAGADRIGASALIQAAIEAGYTPK